MRKLCFLSLLAACTATYSRAEDPPPLAREFRAAWVATVANIDWPSKPGLPAVEQKKELIAILDKCQALNLNAIVMQVRPMCDALHESNLEPWSEYLTGEQGKSPGYDPLAFAVEESHKRNIELHAWFNPYRAAGPTSKSAPAKNHMVKARPDLAKKYGKHYWLNPTHPEVQKHSLAVVLDVVRRYDIDGVHMDDYFYPYPEAGEDKKEMPFPDDDTWDAYKKSGGRMARDDWRRDAVNQFVKAFYFETHKIKPWVKVGISPFGIWRPGHPEGIKGFDQYSKLYADAKLWLNEGWVDYYTPQLYWVVDKPDQSYPALLKWWSDENVKLRNLWPGNFTSKWDAAEIAKQIDVTRKSGTATGNVHFSMKAITGEKFDSLKKLYAEPALVPASPWLGFAKPHAPILCWGPASDSGRTLYVDLVRQAMRSIVVRERMAEGWKTTIIPTAGRTCVPHRVEQTVGEIVIQVEDRVGNVSDPVRIRN